MVRKSAVLCCLLALSVQGCRRQNPLVPPEVEKEIDIAIQKLGNSNVMHPWRRVMEEMRAISNDEVRVACRQMKRARLFAVELTGDDYERLTRLFRNVWTGLLPYSGTKAGAGRWTIIDACEAEVRRFTWMRRELDRWKAMAQDGRAAKMRTESPVEYGNWRRAYRYCLEEYESQVRLCELWFEDRCRDSHAIAEERERAKSLLEEFLGRPMRTKEELQKDRRERKTSDEMRALQ